MQGLVTMIAASAVLSAGVVAGLAATDAAARPKPATEGVPIAAPAATKTFKLDPKIVPRTVGVSDSGISKGEASMGEASKGEVPKATCAAGAWPYLPAGCAAEARKVRIIALTGR